MTNYVIPAIGSSGYFLLKAPFNVLVTEGERYTCQGIRRISEYIANNENPKETIYIKNGLTEDDFEDAKKTDMSIASLQSEKGHWLYVPCTHILSYPEVNGIPYRALAMVVSLPSLPVDTDLTSISTSIRDMISDRLGVDSSVKLVETSRVVLVTEDIHSVKSAERSLRAVDKTTDYGRAQKLKQELDNALYVISELEKFITDNYVAEP